MLCRSCNASTRKFGKTKTGDQRYQCIVCKTISTDSPKKVVRLDRSKVLHFAYYNFCRIHSSLRVTPAMEAGVTNHLWSLDELIGGLP